MSRRAQLPLDPDAVAQANKKLWQRFPELKGRQLTPDDDPKYRKAWMDLYQKAGGAMQEPVTASPDETWESCPSEKQPVDVEFRRVYWDGTPIPNLPYDIELPNGTKTSGQTDADGYACHKDVTPGEAIVTYGQDPNPPECSIGMEIDDELQAFFKLE